MLVLEAEITHINHTLPRLKFGNLRQIRLADVLGIVFHVIVMVLVNIYLVYFNY